MNSLCVDTRVGLGALTLLLGAAACGGDAATADPDAPFAVVATGLSTPESVLWDAGRQVWYVSNINGPAMAKDDNGYILRLTAEGAMMDSLPFINGADEDIVLNAPKGMALVGDTLWVADIDALRAFNVVSGTAVTTLELGAQRATFLNDVAAAPDGSLLITDSGFAIDADGRITYPGESRVFQLVGRNARTVVGLPERSGANGIAYDAARGRWLIVGDAPSLFGWTEGSDTIEVLAPMPGEKDGLVLLDDGRALFSNWTDSSLSVLAADGRVSQVRGGLPEAADLGYDPVRRLVAVPLSGRHRLEIWPLR